ncbi:sugar phosphate isomerase/epimerase [Labilibacter sediminis]|nr:sugar phosphate isomerase/epimerase [Labilibacter sediminis]
MQNTSILLILIPMLLSSCSPQRAKTSASEKEEKISVAEWSLHRSINSGQIDHLDFPRIVKDSFNLQHIEYVSQFFQDKVEDFNYLDQMKDSCEKYGVTNLLIMVDAEGELGDLQEDARKKSVENHKKWVKAASYLNCKAIRVNGNGLGNLDQVQSALVKSLKELSVFAADHNIVIVVENHGMMIPGKGWSNYAPSTNGKWLAQVFEKVNMHNCKALPDFGNFDKYDRYEGMKDLMPYAYGVSAKTVIFDENGEDTQTNFKQVFDIIHAHDFEGFVGIEFEGPTHSITEFEGIQKTLNLIRQYY